MTPEEIKTLKKDVAEKMKETLIPIDFEDLENRGVLKKDGAWYWVLKPEELPKYAWDRISETQIENGKMKVKFEKLSKKDEKMFRAALKNPE